MVALIALSSRCNPYFQHCNNALGVGCSLRMDSWFFLWFLWHHWGKLWLLQMVQTIVSGVFQGIVSDESWIGVRHLLHWIISLRYVCHAIFSSFLYRSLHFHMHLILVLLIHLCRGSFSHLPQCSLGLEFLLPSKVWQLSIKNCKPLEGEWRKWYHNFYSMLLNRPCWRCTGIVSNLI